MSASQPPVIDLNADLGEGFGAWTLGDDRALLEVITSANVACGYHAGDATTMRRVCAQAVERGVRVGAQVGYRDLAGFGRRFIDVEPGRLRDEVLHQVGALDTFARVAGDRVRYVKPHGALYHAVVDHLGQADAVVEAVREFDPRLVVLGLPGSALLRLAADAGLRTVEEAFADRGYATDGSLVPRDQPGAVVTDRESVAARSVELAAGRGVVDVSGRRLPVRAGSLCLHGDTPGATGLARAVRTALEEAGVRIRSFTGDA